MPRRCSRSTATASTSWPRSLLEHETIDGAEVERLVELGRKGSRAVDVFGEREPANGAGAGTDPEHTDQIPATTTARMRKP